MPVSLIAVSLWLEFMKPDVWNGLVIGITVIGLAMAVLRLLRDWTHYRLQQRRQQATEHAHSPEHNHSLDQ